MSVEIDRNQWRHRRRTRACAQPCAKRQPPRLICRTSRTRRIRMRTVLTTWHEGVTKDPCVSHDLFVVEKRRSWMRKLSTHRDSQNLVRHSHCARLTKLWYQQVVKRRGRYGLLSTVTSSAAAMQQISDAIARWCALFAVKWHLLISSRRVLGKQ